MSSSISRIQASNIDGRAQAPRFIQNQLQALHSSLLTNASEIRQAIASSSHHTPAEVGIEYYLAVSAVKDHYASIDFNRLLDEEYSIANGKDAPDRRVAAGIVYIVPTSHTLFYSTVAALSAAIAAGNCVVLELSQTLSKINSVLRKIFPQALDADTFTIVDATPGDLNSLKSCIQVLPTPSASPTATVLVSPSTSRAVGIVDRSSNLQSAASALVTARFSFGGHSPYAPDLVLVNEFVIDEFSDLVVQQAARIFSKTLSSAKSGEKRRKALSEEEPREEGTVVVVSGDSGSILKVKKRQSKLLQRKFTEPVLVLHSVSSLDDAIDFTNKSGGASALLATYLFANLPAAKYLSQFIDSHLTLVNQIPPELLVGPAAPLNYPPNLSPSNRFTKTMFTVPRPSYISAPSPASKSLTALLNSTSTTASTAELDKEALTELPPIGQKPGHHLGFFEQGIVTGMATILLPAAVGTLALAGFGVRTAVRYVKR